MNRCTKLRELKILPLKHFPITSNPVLSEKFNLIRFLIRACSPRGLFYYSRISFSYTKYCTGALKFIPQQAQLARGGPSRLRPRIFLTFGTTRVVGRQPYAPAAFTSGKIPDTHFQRLSRPQGTWFRRGEPRKKSPVTPPGPSD